MTKDRDLLLRYLEGDLSPDEADRLRTRLAEEPALREGLGRVERLRQTMRAGSADAFAPYFSERLLRRLAPTPAEAASQSLYESMRWIFARAALAVLLVAAVLGSYNVVDYQGMEIASSVLEAVFGLPSASLMDAFSYGAL